MKVMQGRFPALCFCFALFVGCSAKTAYVPRTDKLLAKADASLEVKDEDPSLRVENIEDAKAYEDSGACLNVPENIVEKAELVPVDLDEEQYRKIKFGKETIHKNVLNSLIKESSSLALKDDFDIPVISLLEDKDERKSKIRDELSVIKMTKYDMPITINRYVLNVIHFYLKRHKKRFAIYLGRSRKYADMVNRILAEEGLPADLAYLPLIESGYSPKAYSWAHASGLWQFIKPTGKHYGLKINWWLDERRDPEKSTRAAAKYLKKLYNQFGSWELALASYNAGENRVERAVKRQKTKDFWKLRLPRQTRNYVPAFMAATILAKNYKFYGFDVPEETEEKKEYEPYLIKKRSIGLKRIANYLNINYKELANANLELRRKTVPYLKDGYYIKLPKGKGAELELALQNHKPKLRRYVSGVDEYTVERGDTLYGISKAYNVSLYDLIAVNDLGNGNYIRPGFKIRLPVYDASSKRVSRHRKKSRSLASVRKKGYSRSSYKVKRGDTLGKIARRFNVSLSSLKRWNNIRNVRHLRVGKKIVIYKKSGVSLHAKKSSSKHITYTVRRGDTLGKIARRFNVRLSSLKKWNKIRNSRYLKVGKKITIYRKYAKRATKHGDDTVYTVKRGDTLWDIAGAHNIKFAKLLKQNGLRHNSSIRPGDRLTLKTAHN